MASPGWLRALMGVRTVVLDSPLSLPECQRRVRAEVDETEAMFGRQAVVGWFEKDRAQLRVRNGGPNAFSTVLRVQFMPHGSGVSLTCQTGTGPLGLGLLAIWCGGLMVVWLGLLAMILYGRFVGSPSDLNAGNVLVGFPELIIVSVGIGAAGRLTARSQDQFLLEFVATRADAKRSP